MITPDAGRVRPKGTSTPSSIKAALTPEDLAGGHDPRVQRAGHRAADRAIAPIVRAAGASSWSMPPSRRAWCPSTCEPSPIDLLAFPGHKALYGPTGTGALYVGPRADGRIRPWREGGTGGDSSSETQPALIPYFLEGGTPNVLGVAGLAAGIAWVAEHGPDELRAHEVGLLQQVVDWVEQADGWQIAGRWDPADATSGPSR